MLEITYNMDTLSEHLGHKTISFKDLVGTETIKFFRGGFKSATEYAAEDADITFRLYEALSERVSEEKLERVYESLKKPMIKFFLSLINRYKS